MFLACFFVVTFAVMKAVIIFDDWMLQASVRVSVNNWHAKRSSSSLFRCCKISTSNLQKDKTVLKYMKSGEEQMYLLRIQLEWLSDDRSMLIIFRRVLLITQNQAGRCLTRTK